MRILDHLRPEIKDNASKALMVIVAVSMLYIASQDFSPKLATAQTEPAIVGGRLATQEESRFMAKVRSNNKHCSATVTGENTIMTADHCTGDTIDSILNLETRVDLYADGIDKTYNVSRIIQPHSKDIPNPDVVVLVLDEPIPANNGVEPVIIDQATSLEDNFEGEDLQIMGFGKTETGYGSPDPIIADTFIRPLEETECIPSERRFLVYNDRKTFSDSGDSGGFFGYIKKDKFGNLKGHQIGVTSTICMNTENFQESVADELHKNIKDIIAKAEIQTLYEPVPPTETSLLIDSMEVERESFNRKFAYNGVTTYQTIVFDHYQDETAETEVSITGMRVEAPENSSCVQLSQDISQLPITLHNGENPAPSLIITSQCKGSPFHETILGTIKQEIDLEKTVVDGILTTTAKAETRLYMVDPLKIDVSKVTTDTMIYKTDDAAIIIYATLDTNNRQVTLRLVSKGKAVKLYYTFTGQINIQAETATQVSTLEWPEEPSADNMFITTLTLPIPEGLIQEKSELLLPFIESVQPPRSEIHLPLAIH